jgi:hypothetical protein
VLIETASASCLQLTADSTYDSRARNQISTPTAPESQDDVAEPHCVFLRVLSDTRYSISGNVQHR